MPKPNKDTAMLCDVQYIDANKQTGQPDYLYVIWKDTETDEKHLQVVPEPMMDIYFEKPEVRTTHTHNKNYAKLEDLYKVSVKYKDIKFRIAEELGEKGKMFLQNVFQTRNYKELSRLFLYPYTFGSDYDVGAWYRIQWYLNLNNNAPKKLKKGFLDIEVDGFNVPGMPSPNDCPINAITLIDDYHKVSYTFVLTSVPEFKELPGANNTLRRMQYEQRVKDTEWIKEQLETLPDNLHQRFDESYGSMDYRIYTYEDERKMLIHLFQLINKLKLDFVGIWNISFDIPYIMDRARALGLDPVDLMCHPDFPSKKCYFKHDTRNHDIKNKNDVFYCSSYTTFYDQMELYASIRKGASELRSYKLNFIANKELKDSKLDYSEDGDIKTLPYTNFILFIIYNIKDVLLQVGIERRTTDFDTLYVSSYENATPYDKVFKQTVKLRNVQYISFLSQGLIPGNNINVFNIDSNYKESQVLNDDDEDDDSFEGALVADPQYNGYEGVEMYGRKTNNVFRSAIDFDMTAFYPSSIMGMNIDPSTLIFKVILPISQYDLFSGDIPFRGITGEYFNRLDDAGKECIDNFQTQNYMTAATKWMNFPDVSEVYEYMKGVM